MRKKEWKRRAKQLAAELESAERDVDVFGSRVAAYRDDFSRLWDIVGEEPGDRNEHGVRNLAVVLERRMAELHQLRKNQRVNASEVYGLMTVVQLLSDGDISSGRFRECLAEWVGGRREWAPVDFGWEEWPHSPGWAQQWRDGWRSPEPSVFGPMIPEPDERVCSGALLEIWWPCQRKTGPWKSHRTPCATMTGCDEMGAVECFQCWHVDWNTAGHTNPCGVMS